MAYGTHHVDKAQQLVHIRPKTRSSAPFTSLVMSNAHGIEQTLDIDMLCADLCENLQAEVRFDNGTRALYATDASNFRMPPIGVVIPTSVDDILQTVAICQRHGAPVLPRGGGTSLGGQCCNVAVIIDMSKYLNRVVSLDPVKRLGRVQPGLILDDLIRRAQDFGLTFGPDPSTHNHCTLGGMLGNNSCGVHSVMAVDAGNGARTSDNLHSLEILTYDGLRLRVGETREDELEQIIRDGGQRGEIYGKLRTLRDKYGNLIRQRFPKLPRRVSGYNLDELLPENGFNVARALVGTEGTCVLILDATVKLIPNPRYRTLLVLGYPDVYSAGEHIPEIMSFHPIGCEGIDDKLVGYIREKDLRVDGLRLLPSGSGWLMVEFGADSQKDSDDQARAAMEALGKTNRPPSARCYGNPKDSSMLWLIRKSGLGATAFIPGRPDAWPGWDDAAVPPARIGAYLRGFRALLDKHEYDCALYGHFGQGCVHCRINFDLVTQPGIDKYVSFLNEAADLVLSHGGSLSGEHGDGQARAAMLPKMFGVELVQAFREFKAIWDPNGKMNPGKVIDSYPPDHNLRLGAGFHPKLPDTHFAFQEDDGEFARATLRCVGVGECRRMDGGVMCPSFMATREEMHSTRGRAHLLFEMMHKDVLSDSWRDENVHEALDLCLSCKGCKGECPVNVDVATYKAEFLSHYYEGRLRSRHAYAFGLIFYWARLAAWVPELANFFDSNAAASRHHQGPRRHCARTDASQILSHDIHPMVPKKSQPDFLGGARSGHQRNP